MKFEIIARIFSFMNISEISAPSSGMKGSPRANRGSSKKITRMEVSPDESFSLEYAHAKKDSKNIQREPAQLADLMHPHKESKLLSEDVGSNENTELDSETEMLESTILVPQMSGALVNGTSNTPATGLAPNIPEVTPDEPKIAPADVVTTPVRSSGEGDSKHISTNDDISSPSKQNDQEQLRPLTALPDVPNSSMTRQFRIEGIDGVEITSLDVTAHGCYVIAGCGNGMVLLFDLTQNLHEPALIGHIMAKGLHTNLLMNVKITEDCRFCFAGVTKGSSELLAIDLGKLPSWGDPTFQPVRRPENFVNDRVTCYSRSDPKLRGFGAAVRVRGNYDHDTYRLASGLGIKNVHVWQFTPPTGDVGEPTWVCMYDVASNGNTIEKIGFRNDGHELMSKSVGVSLRVWDLSTFDSAPEEKPSFTDVGNSNDVRCLLDGFAFGGVYEFAIVRVNAPKAANRDALEMPERNNSDGGDRRRRLMRQIDGVIGTEDAHHAMILCADGGVLYYKRPAEGSHDRGSLVEVPSIERDPDTLIQAGARDWSLRRVGSRGEVILLRVTQTSPVKVLVAPIAQSLIKSNINESTENLHWTRWGYYCGAAEVDRAAPLAVPSPIRTPRNKERKEGTDENRNNSVASSGSKRKAESNTHLKQRSAPQPTARTGRPPLAPQPGLAPAPKRPRKNLGEKLLHGAPTINYPDSHTLAQHQQAHYQHQQPRNQRKLSAAEAAAIAAMNAPKYAPGDDDIEPFVFVEPPKIRREPLSLKEPRKVRRIVTRPFNVRSYIESDNGDHPHQPSVANIVMTRFKGLCTHWIESSRKTLLVPDALLPFKVPNDKAAGICYLRKLGELCAEQERLRSAFVGEVTRTVARHLMTLNGASLPSNEVEAVTEAVSNGPEDTHDLLSSSLPLPEIAADVESLVVRFRQAVAEMLHRQSSEIAGARANDSLRGESAKPAASSSDQRLQEDVVQFPYDDILWTGARSFAHTVRLVVNAALKQVK